VTTEQEALEQINSRVANAGYPNLFAEWHGEKVSENSTIRSVQFKLAITRDNREQIIKAVHRIGAETDEEIIYLGGSSSFQQGADLVLLLFQADIHPITGC